MFYGGARAGGKSFAILLDFLRHATWYGKDANGLLVRREVTQLVDLIRESKKIFEPLGWTWFESKKTWVTPEGAELRFDHLEDDDDAAKYQGWNLTWFGVEEITTFPRPEPIFRIMACLRSPRPDLKVNFRATGNPGGPGHLWVKSRYIDPAPLGYKIIPDPETGLERFFIPAKAKDNQYISPDYLERVKMAAPNPNILKGWLDGNWDFAEGSFFDEFNKYLHVIPAFKVPDHWPRYCAMDPGSSDPTAILWGAVVPEDYEVTDGNDPFQYQGGLPRNSIVIYREMYLAKHSTDIGLKLSIEEIAHRINQIERYQIINGIRFDEPLAQDGRLKIQKRVAGLDLFNHKNGPSLAERIAVSPHNLWFNKAETARIDRKGAWGGWNLVRFRLQGQDGLPMVYFMDNCVNLIRTLPILQMDEINPEDVKSCSYDHLADALRYLLQCRPYVPSGYSEIAAFKYPTQAKNSTTVLMHPPEGGWQKELEDDFAPVKRTAPTLKLGGSKRIR